MKKSLMLGTMAIAAIATVSAAQAKKYEYGFHSPSGTAYCDGLEFTVTNGIASGYHIYDQAYCPYPEAVLGGYEGTVPVLGAGKWYTLAGSQASGDGLPDSYTLIYYANIKALTWALAYESSEYTIPFTPINAGVLVKGAPGAFHKPGMKMLGTSMKAGLAHIGK